MNKRVKDIYLNEIERYIQFLKKLTTEQVEQMKEGNAYVEFVYQGSKADKKLAVTPENKEYVSILMSIEEMNSKQEVEKYFRSLGLKRIDLEAMCKLKDIPFSKRDNMSVLKDKIYERMLGFKLRSRAIQNDK